MSETNKELIPITIHISREDVEKIITASQLDQAVLADQWIKELCDKPQ